MVVLDYLAYQHRDDWEKQGFSIVDAIGTVKFDFSGEKVVTARLLAGVEYDKQVFSDVEGGDQSKMAPFAVREIAPNIPVVATIEECVAAINENETPEMGSIEKESKDNGEGDKHDETRDIPSVDEAFL